MPLIPFLKASGFLAIACLLGSSGAALAQYQTIPSMPLFTFQDSMGVNTHIEYTDGKYANATAVLNDLKFIGIHNLRDGVPDPINWLPHGQALAAMQMLAQNGMKFDFIIGCNSDLPTEMTQLDDLLRAYPGVAKSVEGPNEINNFACNGSMNNEAFAENFQRQLYQAVHSDPLASGVPVYYMTGAAPVNLRTDPGLADVANTHPYPPKGLQPYGPITWVFPSEFTMGGSYPKAITETGYATLPYPTDPDGVDEPAQAEMMLNLYFDAALEGISHTYVYQLLDPYPDPNNNNADNNYGFFHLDGSPKIIAYAMNNMASVLPPDRPSAPVNVQASIAGLPSGTGHSLALTGSDGSVTVFMWNETSVWNQGSQSLQEYNPIPVQVSIPGSWNVSYFTPAENATFPLSAVNGQYQAYVTTYPTAFIFKKK